MVYHHFKPCNSHIHTSKIRGRLLATSSWDSWKVEFSHWLRLRETPSRVHFWDQRLHFSQHVCYMPGVKGIGSTSIKHVTLKTTSDAPVY